MTEFILSVHLPVLVLSYQDVVVASLTILCYDGGIIHSDMHV